MAKSKTVQVSEMPLLSILAFLLGISVLSDSVPINKDDNSFGFGVQNTTYDSEQSVCVVDDVLYRAGDSLASANACERCVCSPPEFVCEPVACPMSPGCRAVQRAGQCCPSYHCECEVDGKTYQNGEKVEAADWPCHVCYCRGGHVVCAALECYRRLDCAPRQEPGACCPKYDHCPPLENVHRKQQQFPISTSAEETDNHIHRTLLLEDDQQLDSTNTDERILRLGETPSLARQPNLHGADQTQSDEVVQIQQKRVSVQNVSFNNQNPIKEHETVSGKKVEGPTTLNSFENLQTPNYSVEDKQTVSPEIKENSQEPSEITENINTEANLEIQSNDFSGTAHTAYQGVSTLNEENSDFASHITESYTTEISKNNLNDSTEVNLLFATDRQNQHPTTTDLVPTEENLIANDKEEDNNDHSTVDVLEYPKESQEGETASQYFQEHTTSATTVSFESETLSEGLNINKKSKPNEIEAYNYSYMQNDFTTESTKEIIEHSDASTDFNSDKYTTENPVYINIERRENELELSTTMATKIPFDESVVTETERAYISQIDTARDTMPFNENEKAESQRTSPIITNIRVTDDDEYDGGVITDDAEESTDDNRPPITTDKIFYSYDKNDSSKPTTIEAFAVSGNTLVTEEGFSTPVYNDRHIFTTTIAQVDSATEQALYVGNNEVFDSNGQLSTMTPESEETILKDEGTTVTPIIKSDNILNDTNTLELTNKTNHEGSIYETKTTVAMNPVIHKQGDSNISTNISSFESSKVELENMHKAVDVDNKVIAKSSKNESLVIKYNSSNASVVDFDSKQHTLISNPSETQKSEVDRADTFVREEPPVLLFKNEMAIHQMDVVVADDEEELEQSSEDHNPEPNDVIVSTTTDAAIDNLSADPVDTTNSDKETETKKLLEKGYITGLLNDDGSLSGSQKGVSVNITSGTSTFNTTDINDEERELTKIEGSSITTIENKVDMQGIDDTQDISEGNITNAYLTSTPEPSTEKTELEEKYLPDNDSEPPAISISTTMLSDNEPTTTLNPHLEKLESVSNSDEFNKPSKILLDIVPLRHNVSLHEHEKQQNFTLPQQESTTLEVPILPENWLKYINDSAKEDNVLVPSTTPVVDSTENLSDLTFLNDSSETTTEDSNQTTYFETLSDSSVELGYSDTNATDTHGSADKGSVQTAKERNFRSDDSENLDKQDLLVLQEFFRKLYHH